METENLIENSRKKLTSKNADIICANTIAEGRSGFQCNTNEITIITPTAVTSLPLCSKEETADKILDACIY
jgi:phosphopantothenoylcysteine decarboxylase/phosphopantothenate--cysteine ligase